LELCEPSKNSQARSRKPNAIFEVFFSKFQKKISGTPHRKLEPISKTQKARSKKLGRATISSNKKKERAAPFLQRI
jgi:hypothetical protein